jgi:transposase-like protein
MKIAEALVKLGHQEFVCNDTYESIVWIVEPTNKPTKEEVENMANLIVSLEQEEKIAKQAKLESAKAKLAALGLDEEEVQAIIGGI